MKPAPNILIVDDNPADVTLVREALAGSKHRSQLRSVARSYLRLDVGARFAAGGVGAVAASATGFVFAAAGVGLSGSEAGNCEQENGEA